MKTTCCLIVLVIPFLLNAQSELINAGPMPGYSEMREVPIWVQTKKEAVINAIYWVNGFPDSVFQTNTVHTEKENAFTAILIADSLEPGFDYTYQLVVNGQKITFPHETIFSTQKIWKWRDDPPDFSFLIGSCAYINETRFDRPGKPYGDKFEIFNAMADHKVNFMIWLGDNIYFREPDWNSWTGIIQRYTHDRAIPELQRFLASTHHYAIWDDHDYGPNNSDRGYWMKNKTLEAFKLFWANPSYGVGDLNGTITFFNYADADFFLLDNRTYRTPDRLNAEHKTQLGKKQLQWIFDNLITSEATFKFVVIGGQFLSTASEYEMYTNYGFDKERQEIIDFIYEYDLTNVIFLTGDVHFSEVSVLEKEGEPTIWDFTVSPLNSGVNIDALELNNSLRIPESVIMERNYAQLQITGPTKQRELQITFYDYNGQELYRYDVKSEKVFNY